MIAPKATCYQHAVFSFLIILHKQKEIHSFIIMLFLYYNKNYNFLYADHLNASCLCVVFPFPDGVDDIQRRGVVADDLDGAVGISGMDGKADRSVL